MFGLTVTALIYVGLVLTGWLTLATLLGLVVGKSLHAASTSLPVAADERETVR